MPKKNRIPKTPFRGKVTYGKTKAEKKIVTPLSEEQDKERQLRKQRDKDLQSAAEIYTRWRGILTSRKRTQPEILERVGQLIEDIDKIGSPNLDYCVNEIITPIIQQLSTAVMMEKFTTKILVDCPGKTIKNGVESDCGWGGVALFHNDLWFNGRCEMDCPQCGRRLKQTHPEDKELSDMMLESIAKKWLEEQKAK